MFDTPIRATPEDVPTNDTKVFMSDPIKRMTVAVSPADVYRIIKEGDERKISIMLALLFNNL